MVAHLTGGQGVAGSNPVSPTGEIPDQRHILVRVSHCQTQSGPILAATECGKPARRCGGSGLCQPLSRDFLNPAGMSENRVIVEAVLAGQSHGSVARQYGISKVWVGKLVARWRAGGWPRGAKSSPAGSRRVFHERSTRSGSAECSRRGRDVRFPWRSVPSPAIHRKSD